MRRSADRAGFRRQPGKGVFGKWDTVTRMWWGGPGTPATEMPGTAENKWVLNGRYVQATYKGQFMMPDEKGGMSPMPFAGLGLTGYDNYRNMYTNTWADNMGTQMHISKGGASPDGKVFSYYGEMDEPMLKVTGRMVKYTVTITDNDKHIMEMYDLHAGSEYKVMEITYARQK